MKENFKEVEIIAELEKLNLEFGVAREQNCTLLRVRRRIQVSYYG